METLIFCIVLIFPAVVALILEERLPARHKGEYCLLCCPVLGHFLLGLLVLLWLLGLPFQVCEWATSAGSSRANDI